MKATTGLNKVKKLALISCNGFYSWSAGTPSHIVGSSTPYGFCGTNDVPLDFRNQARSFKVKSMSKSLSNQILKGEFSSPCLTFSDAAANGVSSLRETDLRIPSSNTPVQVTLFRDSACTDILSHQPMLEGLSFTYEGQKFFLNNAASNWGGLVVPSNQTRRGTSHFMNLLPSFKCAGNLCVDGPLSRAYDYYAARSPGGSSTVRVVIDQDKNSTASDYAIAPNGTGWVTSATCNKSDEEFYCDFNLVQSGTDCADGVNNYCWSDAGKTFSFGYSKDGSAATNKDVYVFKNEKDLHALGISLRLTGSKPDTPRVGRMDSDFNDSPNGDYGALDLARMLLSPEIGGLISLPGQSCATAQATRQLTLNEEGLNKEYEISIFNTIPISLNTYQTPFFCTAANADLDPCAGGNDQTYQKRISVKRKMPSGAWELFLVSDFSCDSTKRSGRVQEIHKDYFSGSSDLERMESLTMAWFTPPSGMERFELYNQRYEYDSSSQVTRYEAGFNRVYKLTTTNFEIDGMNYSREYSTASVFSESASRYFFQLNGNFLYSDVFMVHRPTSIDSEDPNTNLFTDTSFSDDIDSIDLRFATSISAVDTKFTLTSPAVTTGAAIGFNGYGPASTSVGNLPLSIDQLQPTEFSPVFTDGFFP